jgi:hypothetical protein
VEEKTDQIWMFQRYRLVSEFSDSTFLPPPISYLEYFIMIIKHFRNKNKAQEIEESDGLFEF